MSRELRSLTGFPHYSQLDQKWGFERGTERSMCGVICTKAVMDFYAQDSPAPGIEELLNAVHDVNGLKADGIQHAVEVNLLQDQGLLAWRRNWVAPTADPQWLVDNEGYGGDQVLAIQAQLANEQLGRTLAEQELISIQTSLNVHRPVIASMAANFGGNTGDHQVVLVGMSQDDGQILIMDPEWQPGSEIRVETIARFLEYFNHRAIFTRGD